MATYNLSNTAGEIDAGISRAYAKIGRTGGFNTFFGSDNTIDDLVVGSVIIGNNITVEAVTNCSSFGNYNNLYAGANNCSAFGYSNAIVDAPFFSFALGGQNTCGEGLHNSSVGYSNISLGGYASSFGYGNTTNGNKSSAFGKSNTCFAADSSAFGSGNLINYLGSKAFALGNTNIVDATGSSAIGHGIKNYTNKTQEFGYWPSSSGRGSAIRLHGASGYAAISVPVGNTGYAAWTGDAGYETDGSVFRGGLAFKVRSDNGQLWAFYNSGGVMKSGQVASLV